MIQKSIVFILPDLEMGGAERIVTTLANNLPREKFRPSIMLMRKQGHYLTLLKEDVEVIDLKVERIRQSLLPILKTLRKIKPDIVFCGYGEVNAYLSLFTKLFPKTKFVARETNVVSEHVKRPEIKFFYRFYNNFDRIICQSDDMQNDLLKHFNLKSSKMVKINNPVDFEFITQQLAEQDKPNEYKDDVKNVVAVGNLSARKGFDNLLKVFTHLKQDNIHLHILGDGADKELLNNLKNEFGLDKVTFHGKKSNPYPYLKFADLFILSSRYEGFPNVLLEAGACGTYALANDCPGGIQEIVQPGKNGVIGIIENESEFAEQIRTTLSENHNADEVRKSIHDRFSKEIILQKYIEVLENL